MARHRWDAPPGSDTAPDVDLPRPRSARPHRYLDPELAEHSGELPAAPRHSHRRPEEPSAVDGGDAPGPRTGAHGAPRLDPDTTPLDLAAIALAAARTSTGSHRLPPLDGDDPITARGSRPATHSPPPAPGRALRSTRTVGALAVLGAVVGAGVAAAGGGAMLATDTAAATAEAEVEVEVAVATTGAVPGR